MAINRVEKEALDTVCGIASPAGSLRKVIDGIDLAVSNIDAILKGDAIIPDEMVENMENGKKELLGFKEAYMAKAGDLAESNRKLSEDVARRMSTADKTSSDAKAQMATSMAATEEIKGGVK